MVTKTPPPKVANPRLLVVPYVVAAFTLLLALLQLANFEAFVLNLTTYSLFTQQTTVTLAILLLASEIFSLPFLLRLWLSPLARLISAALVLLTPLTWLIVLLLPVVTHQAINNVGVFGDFVSLPLNSWVILSAAGFVAASLYSFAVLGGRQVVANTRGAK